MICPICHGTGFVNRHFSGETGTVPQTLPCPECGGTGIGHCCDGHQPTARDEEIACARPDHQPKEEH